MSTIKSDSIQPTSTSNNLILRTGVGDVERMRIGPAGGVTFSSAVGMDNGLTASVLDVTGTTKLNGSVYAATDVYAGANVYATGGTVVMSSAYSHRNRIINGDMRVNQRGVTGATSGLVGGGRTRNFDMWYMERNTTGGAGATFSYRGGQTGDGVTASGHQQYLRATTPAGTPPALSATQYGLVLTTIEADNIQDWLYGQPNAQTTTLSFWVRSSVTGNHSAAIQNYNTNAQTFPFQYNVAAANTWEYKSQVIPGCTDGTWPVNRYEPRVNSYGGAYVIWTIGAGANYQTATGGTWRVGASPNLAVSTDAVQLISTASATLDITGIQWELGSVATPFEYRPFSVELAMCQRYYQNYRIDKIPVNTSVTGLVQADLYKAFYIVGAHSSGGGEALMGVALPVEMRALPAIGGRGLYGGSAFNDATTGFGGSGVASYGFGQVGSKSIQYINIGAAAGAHTGGQYLGFDLSAEL